jgi:hypothetical protein
MKMLSTTTGGKLHPQYKQVAPCVVGASVIIFKARRNTTFFLKLSSRLFSKNPIVKKIFKFIFNDINHSKFNDFLLP